MDRDNSNDRTTARVIAATVIIASVALLALAGLGGVSCAAGGENAGGSEGEMTGAAVSAAGMTNSINYQGRLTDSSGSPLTGTYGITFRLYDVSTGGTALDTDAHDVNVTDGLFNTGVDFDQSYFDGRELWLGVTVGADSEMTPRQELRPVPYALSLVPGAVISGSISSHVLKINNTGTGAGVHGVYGETSGNWGWASGVYGKAINDYAIGVTGRNTGGGAGVYGWSNEGPGVLGTSDDDYGVYGVGKYGGYFTTNQGGTSWDNHNAGVNVSTTNRYSDGVRSYTTGGSSEGVYASTTGDGSDGVYASATGYGSRGVYASTTGDGSDGVYASTTGYGSRGVYAYTTGDDSSGVHAYSSKGYGVYGVGKYGGYFRTNQGGTSWDDRNAGVNATTTHDYSDGVYASTTGYGSDGVIASTTGDNSAGVIASTTGGNSEGVYASTTGDYSEGVQVDTAGDYSYGVRVSTAGDYSEGVRAHSHKYHGIYADTGRSDHKYGVYTPDYMYATMYEGGGADVAEYFPTPEDPEPGTVMTIDPAGGSKLRSSTNAYDTTVAGIVSTAPGVSLGTKEDGNDGEKLIAVAGRVPCKVDASYAPITPGDMLTTSDTPGHAMKATNPVIGTILGKALEPLDAGTGTIEVLVTLQ